MSQLLSLNFEDKHLSQPDTSGVGRLGERLAADFLVRHDYQLVLANFKVPIGRNTRGAAVTGEIDLIALDADVLCFIEVKTRRSDEFASPLAAIDLRKQRQITRTARVYRRIFHVTDIGFRFDAVTVVLGSSAAPRIEIFKSFWTEDRFRKKRWSGDGW